MIYFILFLSFLGYFLLALAILTFFYFYLESKYKHIQSSSEIPEYVPAENNEIKEKNNWILISLIGSSLLTFAIYLAISLKKEWLALVFLVLFLIFLYFDPKRIFIRSAFALIFSDIFSIAGRNINTSLSHEGKNLSLELISFIFEVKSTTSEDQERFFNVFKLMIILLLILIHFKTKEPKPNENIDVKVNFYHYIKYIIYIIAVTIIGTFKSDIIFIFMVINAIILIEIMMNTGIKLGTNKKTINKFLPSIKDKIFKITNAIYNNKILSFSFCALIVFLYL